MLRQITLDVGVLLHLIESPLVIKVRVDRSSGRKSGALPANSWLTKKESANLWLANKGYASIEDRKVNSCSNDDSELEQAGLASFGVLVTIAFQPGVVLDVMTLYLGNKFLVRNDTYLLKMWKMSDVESLWDVHFYIEQRDEVPLGIVDPIDLDAISEVLLINSDDDAPIEEIQLSDDEVIVENTDVGGNTVGEGVEDMGGNTVDGEHRGRVGDMGINTNNWSELDPGNLNAKEGYYSTHTSQDGDDGPTQENIDIYDFEFRDLAKEYDNIFAEEEDAVHSVPPQPTYGELRVGMEWATVYECRAYIRQWSIMNKFEYYQEKNENYRVRLFCIDENCEWMFYARRTTDGHTFTLRKSSNLKHTYSSGAKNRLANVSWVAKQVESVMRFVRTTTPVGIQDLISTQFGVDISYYTAWNAWSICKEKIVGSYDEGYIMQPELCLQILHSNPGSIAIVSKDHDTSLWTGTCVIFKASIDGYLNGYRPVVGLDGCFLKVANIFSFANHRHMYKNMKKVYRGTHLERLVWKATRAYKQVEKKNLLDELKLDNPSAHDWLMKELFEHWARSHFDFTAKCEHITNNFFESFNNWIIKIRDKALHKTLEKLNLMLMKLMFDRRQNAKNWEEKGLVLVPRAQTHIDKLKRQYGQYRIEGTKKGMVILAKTYKDVIYHVVDPPEWGQPQPSYFLPPPLVRGPGRPRKERIHDPDEIRPHKRCGTCGYFGHNKTTCKGPPEVPTVRVVRTRQRLDRNTSRVNFMINISLQVDARGERDAGGARGGGRT
ncbi:hypothetical protein GIB67_038147 [Kingdonia uniflora]|uniref:Transposase MuDR plant domain-containing protein n=1 Tax=Kingdonia uniflora TaxID=39325 RepID=A0A7J7KVQ0_9MAGN|nr:hypothetical protein GIB67_038147 [Kingdonia uniflora]